MGETRKIQSIGGMTYSLSLPKQWVQKNKLKKQSEVYVDEDFDGTLKIRPSAPLEDKSKKIFTLRLIDYPDCIDKVLFSAYYLGAETIHIVSEETINAETRLNIKNILKYLSGTEIIYEDEKTIQIKMFLAEDKINIKQLFFRTLLLLSNAVDNLQAKKSQKEAEIAEEEVDRLYHLISKMLILSLHNKHFLATAKIDKELYIVSYFLIGKKLENLGDIFYRFAVGKEYQKIDSNAKKILALIKQILQKYTRFFLQEDTKIELINEFQAIFTILQNMEKNMMRNY